MMKNNDLVGKNFTFEDGVKCEIIQIKKRDDGDWITFHVIGKSVPRKVVMKVDEFLNHYGHLFEDIPPT